MLNATHPHPHAAYSSDSAQTLDRWYCSDGTLPTYIIRVQYGHIEAEKEGREREREGRDRDRKDRRGRDRDRQSRQRQKGRASGDKEDHSTR